MTGWIDLAKEIPDECREVRIRRTDGKTRTAFFDGWFVHLTKGNDFRLPRGQKITHWRYETSETCPTCGHPI